MTQRNNAHNPSEPLKKRFSSTLPAQSICWLGSFSLLSSGFVVAQTESGIDNIVPTVENSQPAVVNPVKKVTIERLRSTSAPESAERTQVEFSQRRANLKKRLRQQVEVTQNQEPVRHSRPKPEPSEAQATVRNPRRDVEATEPKVTARRLRAKIEASRQAPVVIREQKPVFEVRQPRVTIHEEKLEKTERIAQPANSESATAGKQSDYNNAYIDPTEYNANATGNYEAPNSVVLTERSGGCRSILGQGQGVSSSLCAKAPITPSRSQPIADSDTNQPRKSTPNWIRRSQNVQLATVPPVLRVSRTVNSTTRNPNTSTWRSRSIGVTSASADKESVRQPIWRPTRVASRNVSKSEYHPSRFIPNNFISSTTTVSSTPIAPSGGILPLPMTAENAEPRASTVAYNIPLASVLPQIPYSGGTYAYGGSGLIFPLSVPSAITSMFGWRVHPITGDRRFHSGTDLGGAMGTPVLAAYTGQVEVADRVGGYGLTVILNHNFAQQTLYGHMSEILVQPGQWVEQGTVIGRVGSTGNSTGPHLHFEVRQLTADGWVATDPSAQLQYAVNQLVQVLQTAQVPQQPGN
ncbi:MAG: M23 family metallopeptidase [Cyanomargarita calcarea GSE-NOS-MK-12-04C]|jgi:murein DD-endopeptidase MepM/ murein hydrolase activator NlpD|uniref:M23 family metallopeptidase n=1 Tax=Cyanomargarita calcarea GSE-NOS-MK-12-04C TaxID=2839659 RepID=A0A951QMK2_9CYAN|nr:M23 family metallopeptidase [Cyanomargarita calcarea GSE-NOS-MK-12-04C]